MVVVSDLFDELLVRLTPTAREYDLARQHRDVVASRIRLEGLRGFMNSGSYAKRTIIRPFEDIDLFVAFDQSEYEKNPETIVHRLAYHLRMSFPSSEVRVQTHSVGITFSDMFRVDAVPGFAVRGNEGYYRVRNSDDGRWVTTNIELHREFFERRQARDARYREMIRILKHWKRQRRIKVGSYLMELLAARAFRDGIPQGRDAALHHFFDFYSRGGGFDRAIIFTDYYKVGDVTQIPKTPLVVLDPANWRNNVAANVDQPTLETLRNAMDRARARIGTARMASSRREASAIWRELLPEFPSA